MALRRCEAIQFRKIGYDGLSCGFQEVRLEKAVGYDGLRSEKGKERATPNGLEIGTGGKPVRIGTASSPTYVVRVHTWMRSSAHGHSTSAKPKHSPNLINVTSLWQSFVGQARSLRVHVLYIQVSRGCVTFEAPTRRVNRTYCTKKGGYIDAGLVWSFGGFGSGIYGIFFGIRYL
jgi:hypothetical protein